MNPSTTVLFNSPALNTLHRKQLVSLCKRFHIKASGKNADLVTKLQEFAKTLPEAAADNADSSAETHLIKNSIRYSPSSDNLNSAFSSPFKRPTVASSQVGESSPILQNEVAETLNETVSQRNLEDEGTASTLEFETRKIQNLSLSQQTDKTPRALSPSPTKQPQAHIIHRAADLLSPLGALSPVELEASCAMRSLSSGEKPTVRQVSADIEMDEESEVLAAVSLKKQTVRLPSMAFAVSPIKHPPTATSLSTQSPIPGTFPSPTSRNIQSINPEKSSFSPSPFIFGSPRHSVRNHAFMTPVLTAPTPRKSVVSDARLSSEALSASVGLSMREVMEAELKKRVEEKASKGELVRGPGLLNSLTGISSLGHADGKKRRFDDAHEKEFAKMTSIADHYAARRPGQNVTLQKKSTAQRRPSSVVNSNRRTYRPTTTAQIAADGDTERATKKTRFSVLEPTQGPNSDVSSENSMSSVQHGEGDKMQPKDKYEAEADAQRERERTKRKLAIAKAKRSSIAAEKSGRSSLAATPKTLPPKSNTSRLGFLQTGMNAVKKGVSSFTKGAPDLAPGTSSSLQLPTNETSAHDEKEIRTLSSSAKPVSCLSTTASRVASHTLPSKISSNTPRAPIPTFNASSRSTSIRSGLAVGSTPRVPAGTPSLTRTASRLFAPTASSLAKQAGAKTPSTELPTSSSSNSLAIRLKDSAVVNSKRPIVPTIKRSPNGLLPQDQVQTQRAISPAADDSTPQPVSLYPTLPSDGAPLIPGTFLSPFAPNESVTNHTTDLSSLSKSPSRALLKTRSPTKSSVLQPRLTSSTPIRKKRSTTSAQSVGKPSGLSHRAFISSNTDRNGNTPISARVTASPKSRSSHLISISAAKARGRAQARASVSNAQMSTSDISMDAGETDGRSGRLSLAEV